ncbi:RDD family protein [Solitalea canadensis]|uniref:Putative membrane protein/domain protein n=1 Tax=Solitalea canadensis (strain ATCC 29591 / DSM 3403 / JCM 21819 / LMG 8368 / NBRC 15130 / NCIMB 12057 / USAM 9D) TaxID=929556 RepID=H8KLS0_SOLCM|nr:RDD family protein [Solitalea canadensis]AFD09224.1 putative membrane protein/domain protein [Solitalea canadensis DSM 3403]
MSTNISVQTAQNVYLDYELASVGDRILSTLIDWLIIVVYFLFWVVVFSTISQEPGFAFLSLLSLPVLFYHLLMEIFFNGQSIGKRAMKIQVVKLDGSTPSIGDYLLRWLLRIIDISTFYGVIGLVTIVANGKGQRIGDLAAGTTVVKLNSNKDYHDIPVTRIDPSYKVNFPEVTLLNDADINLIKKIINRSLKANREDMLGPVANKVKEITGVQSPLSDYVFLQIVISDYNHLAGITESVG